MLWVMVGGTRGIGGIVDVARRRLLVLALAAAALNLLWAIRTNFGSSSGFFDLRIFVDAGRAFRDGSSPWAVPGFLYPPPAAALFAPLSAFPWWGAAIVFPVAAVAGTLAVLWLLEVRDWRCYAVASAGMPAVTAVSTGTISWLMALLAAVAWRFRDRPWVVASAVAAAIDLKLFMWPLLLWLVGTRRFRTAGLAIAVGVAIAFLALLVPGIGTVRGFFDAMPIAARNGASSYSTLAALVDLGLSQPLAKLVLLATSAVFAAAVLVAARRHVRDLHLFLFCVLATLLLSPVLWIHYLVLALIPIALASRRLNWLWFTPWAVYAVGAGHASSGGSVARIVLALGLTSLPFVVALTTPRAALTECRGRGSSRPRR